MRKYVRTIILLVVFQGFFLLAPGQGNNLLLGDKAYENLQYGTAIEYYVKALKDFTGGVQSRNELVYKLAECFRITNNPRRAEMYYQQLVRNKYADQKPLVYLYYAQSLLNQGRYPDALPVFKQYLAKVPGDAMALAGQASCELGIREKGTDKNWQVKKIPELNTMFDDFAAVYADNQYNTLILSSNRKGTTGKETDSWTNGYFSDLFMASRKKGDLWTSPVLADAQQMVNTEANEGVVSFGDHYRKLYFTRCGKMEKGKEYCQILESERQENGWGTPKVIYSDTLGNVGHPVLTAEGLTMIFSSNQPGGYGSKDLWKTVRTSEQTPFGQPVNLGPEINTSGDEMFPSLLEDTVLYFASNGRAGFGGLDIYKINLGKNGMSASEHLPQPVNSFADDFAMSFEGDNVKGFFSSRRAGGKGGDDVYAFERISGKVTLKGSVRDELTRQPFPQLPVYLFSSSDTAEVLTDQQGTFFFGSDKVKEGGRYTLTAIKENYFTKRIDVSIGQLKRDTTYQMDVTLQPIPEKPVVLPDIYYDLDKWDLLPRYQDSLMTLVKVLRDNPNIVIELASHTDSRASEQYNDSLSMRRAETVVTFLTEKGIDKGRLVAKGYGERVPRLLQTDITRDGYTFNQGTLLTEAYILSIAENRKREAAYQLNRRTEFTVIGKNYK